VGEGKVLRSLILAIDRVERSAPLIDLFFPWG